MGWKKILSFTYFSEARPKGTSFFVARSGFLVKLPGCTGKFLVILRKNLSPAPWDKCAQWCLLSKLPGLYYETSKTPSSCLEAGQIFVRCEIWQMCTRNDLKENFFFLVSLGLFQSEACQNYSVIFARQWNGEDGRFLLPSMLHKASTGIVEVATEFKEEKTRI